MTKKIEKEESCSHGTCNCGKCCCGKIWSLILTALCLVAAIMACVYACKASSVAQKVYNLNVLSAGGIENFTKMNELYSSDAYIQYASEQTDGYITSFKSTYGDIDNEDIEDVDTTNDNYQNNNANSEEVKNIVEDMLASRPVRGDKDARFTIVEYTELLCPFCQRHSQDGTINSVIEQFPGEVNSVSRHFIIHGEEALKLASAMECVAELKPEIYYEVFDRGFESYPVDMNTLISIATELGVDEAAMNSCAEEGKYRDAVNDVMNQGAQLFGVNGTPGNVIIDRETGNYRLVSGAYPVDEFVNAINELKNA